jgi:cytochrome c peroxidase
LNIIRPISARLALVAPVVALALITRPGFAGTPPGQPSLTVAPDLTGLIATLKIDGPIDRRGPFFQSLGTNGRSCSTCHDPQEAMSFTPTHAGILFDATRGRDPLFARVDGANCDDVADGDRGGHSLILHNGLIRIALPVPTNAEFSISVVSDPYGCALRVDPKTHVLTASVYRRPLPATNLSFLSAVMFDGRETVAPLTSEATDAANLRADLTQQAIDATNEHAQATAPPTAAQLDGIVDFELTLYTAQLWDDQAGALEAYGASGGPLVLAAQTYYPGINDTLGQDPNGLPFDPTAMTLYAAWAQGPPASGADVGDRAARAEIAAGEQLFNSAPLTIANVRGLNDNAALGQPTSFQGTCTTCHDAPNVGDHSLPLPLDIGTGHTANPSFESDPIIAAAVSQLSTPQLPVFLISGCPDPFNPGQSASFYTTDPGRALITGHCSDFNRLKGPILRGLAGRAPYFHNGAAATLREVVNFYNQRFQMGLTESQKEELVAFLNSL